jgi:hypothetical protein
MKEDGSRRIVKAGFIARMAPSDRMLTGQAPDL